MELVFKKYDDRDSVTEAIASGPFEVTVVNSFASGVVETLAVDVADFDGTYLEAFLKTVDKFTFALLENAVVWKVARSVKTFNLEGSYVRDALVSGISGGVLDDGVALKVRFEIPGFASSNFREIDLWYNDDFNPLDITALEEIGIELTGNGAEFTIANAVECKVSFKKPTGVTGVIYVVDDAGSNDVIAV
jgi:small nuclear ribonucleoprotein (snRNP)-like protein